MTNAELEMVDAKICYRDAEIYGTPEDQADARRRYAAAIRRCCREAHSAAADNLG